MAIIDQTRWAIKGLNGSNDAYWIVEDFFLRTALNKAGFQTRLDELEQWEAYAFALIQSTINEENSRDAKRKR